MKPSLSGKNLSELLAYDELIKMFKSFSALTGIDVALCDAEGNEVLAYRVSKERCICELMRVQQDLHAACIQNMRYAAQKAAELGEPYIFKCGCLIKCVSPILFEEKLAGCLALGPVLLWETDELTREEIERFLSPCNLPEAEKKNIIDNITELTCDRMTAAANMLYVIVDYICRETGKSLEERKRISEQQRQIAELLIEKKQSGALGKVPGEAEKVLISYVQSGDITNAKRILNKLLGEIFSYSSGNLDIIKAELYELTAVLMRATVDFGVPLERLSGHINEYTKILAKDTTFEDLCYLTSEILEFFISVIYEYRANKMQNKHLINALDYIKSNFHKPLSLNSVADNIYLNRYYLSHLFRTELKVTFSDYLNKVRMEEAARLIRTQGFKIQEVADAVGFRDANYFTKVFKKYYNVTPKKYTET